MLEYLEQQGIISAHTSGLMSQQELIKLAEEAFAMGSKHGIDRYLMNYLDMTPNFDTVDLFDRPEIQQPMGLNGNVKLAAVYSEHSSKKEDFDLY